MAETNPGAHVDEAAWEQLALGEVTAEQREALFDHVLACAQCSRVWKGLLALRAEADAAGVSPARRQPRASRFAAPAMRLALAASLVGAAGIATTYWMRSAPRSAEPISTMREVRTQAALAVTRPMGSVAGPVTFEWSAPPAANGFVVVVYREDGRVLWTSGRVAGSTLEPSSDVPLAPGHYLWRVRAYLGDELIAESPLTGFETR